MQSSSLGVKAIFDHAAELASAPERQAYLDKVCADAPEIRQKVEGLLRAYADAGSFLDKPVIALGETAQAGREQISPNKDDLKVADEAAGTRIGPYKLLQKIGEGGMGAVYVAEQEYPVKRRVALKIIKPGMDSAQVIARFEAERQALAMMDHTNIAKVLDAGTVGGAREEGRGANEAGDSRPSPLFSRPYFVMELVKGVPITKYCDELHLPIRERLALFVPVCQAIQHAHQKGIIHRDLKPSNILVAIQDGQPVAKVIDFGVAKALHQRLTEHTMITEFGAVIGTLEYMSPEQAELSALDIDTRADVYALGVLLYELLTGSTPLDKKRLRSAAFTEMLRIIREVEPPRPSTRLTTSAELPSLAAQRRTEPRKLGAQVKGELDWIVMKCLEKDRTRRYEAASGLGRDIECYLHDEPVEACPPSAAYRLKKFLRKHRTVVNVTLAIVIASVISVIFQTINIIRAHQAEAEARTERDRAQAAEQRAVANEMTARANEHQARVLRDDFEDWGVFVFQAANPNTSETEAALNYRENFLKYVSSVVGPDNAGNLMYMTNLAERYRLAKKLDRAVVLYEQAVPVMKAKLGAGDANTLNAMINLADLYEAQGQPAKAEALLRETKEIRRNQPLPEVRAEDGPRLRRRGDLYSRGAQWLKAATNYAAALKAEPSDHMDWFRGAPLWLQLGDKDAYRRHCREMLRLFGDTNDPAIAHRTAKASLISPDPAADITLLSSLADRAVTGTEKHALYRPFLLTRSLAHLRAGEFHRAIQLDPEPQPSNIIVHAHLVLAMAHHRMGHPEEAAKALGKARAIMDQKEYPRAEIDDLRENWHDWLISHLLRREAETLIEPKKK